MLDFDAAIRRIALESGLSDEQVLQSMQEAIDAGYDSADPAVRAAWRGVAFAGKRPTPRDVVNHCLKRLRDETRLS